jgi:hypothetical protein
MRIYGSFWILLATYEECFWKFFYFRHMKKIYGSSLFYWQHMKNVFGSFLFPSYEEDLWKFYDFIGDI